MTPEERLQYIDVACRAASISIRKEIIDQLLKIIDLVDEKQGKTDLMDIIKLFA